MELPVSKQAVKQRAINEEWANRLNLKTIVGMAQRQADIKLSGRIAGDVAAATVGVSPLAVWRWLSLEDIEALRSGDPAEARAFRAAVAGRRLTPSGYTLPFPAPAPASSRPPRVMCGDCRHFTPDAIGDPRYGIGRCQALADPPEGPLFPREHRHCERFERS